MYSQDESLPSFEADPLVPLSDWFYRLLPVMGTVCCAPDTVLGELARYFCSPETVLRLCEWIDYRLYRCPLYAGVDQQNRLSSV